MGKASDGQTDWLASSELQHICLGKYYLSGYRFTNECTEVAWLIASCSLLDYHTYWFRSGQFLDIKTLEGDGGTTVDLWRFETAPRKLPLRDAEEEAIRLALFVWEKAEPSPIRRLPTPAYVEDEIGNPREMTHVITSFSPNEYATTQRAIQVEDK
jgi:hypothetical protein